MAGPLYRYTGLIWGLMPAIERGLILDYEETHGHIADGTIFEWLRGVLGDPQPDWSTHTEGDFAEMVELFQSLTNSTLPEQFHLRGTNGLALVLAYCVEAIQQRFL